MRFYLNLSQKGRYIRFIHFSYDAFLARQRQFNTREELHLLSLRMKKSTIQSFSQIVCSTKSYQTTGRTTYHDQTLSFFSTNPTGSRIVSGNDDTNAKKRDISICVKPAKTRNRKREERQTKTVSIDWLNKYHKLVQYQLDYGHCHIFKNEDSKISGGVINDNENKYNIIREWIQQQRILYRKKELSPYQIDALQSIPTFTWNTNDARWYAQFVRYQEYQQKLCSNTCNTRPPLPPPSLRSWIYNQSVFYRKQMLAEEKIELLKKVGFPFKTTSHHHKQYSWDYYFNRLKESIITLTEGSIDDENEKDTALSEHSGKVAKQQRQRHHQNMPVLLLNDEKKIIHENLLRWIIRQRTAKKVWDSESIIASKNHNNELTQERIDKLNSINFVWDVYEETWNARISELKDFLTGQDNYLNDTDDTKRSTKTMSPMLSKWIVTVRRDFGRYKKNERDNNKNHFALTKKKNSPTNVLNPQRIRQLEDLNFIWNIQDAQWERQYQIVKHYCNFIYQEKEKHQSMSRQNILSLTSKRTAHWVCRQRKEYKLLKEDNKKSIFVSYTTRLQKLILMNFIWDENDQLWNEKLYLLVQYKISHGRWPSSFPNRKVKKYNSSAVQLLTKQQRQQERMLALFVSDAHNLLNSNQVKKSRKNGYRIEALIEVGFPN